MFDTENFLDVTIPLSEEDSTLSEFSDRDMLLSLLSSQNETLDLLSDLSPVGSSPDGTPSIVNSPSPPQVYQPLLNATTMFPRIKKDPYLPEMFAEAPQNMAQVNHNKEFKDELEEESDRSKKQKIQSAEERETMRAEQQRLASKRYRQKKKVLVEQLEQKMKEITAEKAKIEKEHQETIATVNKLKQENASLKKNHQVEGSKLERDRMTLLSELDELIRNNAPEEMLVVVLHKIRENCKKISSLGRCHVNLLLNPTIVYQLAKNGFFDGQSSAVAIENSRGTLTGFAKKIFSIVTTLSMEQKQRMNSFVEQYSQEYNSLLEERKQLNQEVSTFFSVNPAAFKKENDLPRVVTIMSSIELLRKNFGQEVSKLDEVVSKIMSVLSPKQTAQFYLEAEFQHKSVVQLKNLWDAMRQTVEVQL